MIAEIKNKIEESYYWDARVKKLDCNYFGDEVQLVFEDDEKDITYHFEACYEVIIKHLTDYTKDLSSKELKREQIPYFMQDVNVEEVEMDDKQFLSFVINIHPIEIDIKCLKFTIE